MAEVVHASSYGAAWGGALRSDVSTATRSLSQAVKRGSKTARYAAAAKVHVATALRCPLAVPLEKKARSVASVWSSTTCTFGC